MTQGIIFDIKEFSVNDGPGIRTTIFFKGCPLHCSWCHNPEGIAKNIQLKESGAACLDCGKCRVPCSHAECQPFGRCIHVCPLGRLNPCGREVDAEELAGQVKRQAQFLIRNNGGITLSGGEPLGQPEFLFALMAALKPLHLAVETSGYTPAHHFEQMMALADLVMVDIKHMNNALHARYTGVGNARILANVRLLIEGDRPFIVRIPLIPGVNDDRPNLEAVAHFLSGARALRRVELLPYNVLAGAKYRAVGQEYNPGFAVDGAPNIDAQAFSAHGIDCVVL
jgi:pyruvate formate lyase activating enzyme